MLVCSRDEYIGSRLILSLGGLGESQAGSKDTSPKAVWAHVGSVPKSD